MTRKGNGWSAFQFAMKSSSVNPAGEGCSEVKVERRSPFSPNAVFEALGTKKADREYAPARLH
jgi:hypothetical protein